MRHSIFSAGLLLVFAAANAHAGADVNEKDLKPPALAQGTADPAAIEWLLKTSASSRQATYQGVVVYRDSSTIETLRIVHRHKDGREQERLTSLSGAPRDTVRENDRVSCALPHAHAAAEAQSAAGAQNLLPALSQASLRQVAPHYAIRDLGESRVAGRVNRGVAIVPRDEFRYGYELWADKATAVPLKVSLLDARGRVIEQMLYTEVQFPAQISDKAFATATGGPRLSPPSRSQPPAMASQVAQPPSASAWTLARLPPGFAVAMRSLKPAVAGEGVVEHVLLSDGLAAVSVFSARMAPQDKLFRGFSHLGAMNAYGRSAGVFHVTVVGDVPQATVRMIGDGLTAAE